MVSFDLRMTPEPPLTTPVLRPRPDVSGVGRYRLHEAPARALELVDQLREHGWRGWRDGNTAREWCRLCRRSVTPALMHVCRECAGNGRCWSPQGQHRPVRGWIIKRDGVATPRRFCAWCGVDCGDPPRATWLYAIEFFDHRVSSGVEPCERCGSENGSQLHHWAPSAICADADCWPTSWLCVDCHTAWHGAMRRAAGVAVPGGERERSPNARPGDAWTDRHPVGMVG